MPTLVNSEATTCTAAKIAFVAGERTLTGMRTLVHIESAAFCTSIIAFVARERAFSGVNPFGCDMTASQLAVIKSQTICCVILEG